MRHGLTDWNVKHKPQGRKDVPLNDDDRNMTKDAAKKCRDIDFDICFCSPLVRAKETAEIVLDGRSIKIISDDRLMEMSFGIYEGIEDPLKIPDCPINVLFNSLEKYIIPAEGAESLSSLYSRTKEFLEEVVKPRLKIGKNILIVGHVATICSIVYQMKSLPIEEFWCMKPANCKLIKVL